MKKFYIITSMLFTFFLLSLLTYCILEGSKLPETAHNEQLETYQYLVTAIDQEGIHGKSLNDNTGIFLTYDSVKGMNLKANDKIEVTFPNNSYEIITKVVKVN